MCLSAQPTSQPSMQPSRQPTRQPVARPSMQPSVQPTTNPTTSKPSIKPTSAPSIKPTFVPTVAPTLSEASLLTIKLQNYLSTNLTQNSSASSHASLTVLYQEVVARGAMPAVGGCNNWKVSTGSALSVSLLTQVATSLSMFVYNDNRSVVNRIVWYSLSDVCMLFPLPHSLLFVSTYGLPHLLFSISSFPPATLARQHSAVLRQQQPALSTQSPTPV